MDVIRRVGGCSIDGSVGNIARDDACISELRSAKSESDERVETRDCHFLNESLRMKSLEGGGQSDVPFIQILVDSLSLVQ